MMTTTYRELYIGLMIIPPKEILEVETFDQKTFLLLCLILPLLIIFVVGILGFTMKKCAPKERSVIGNMFYEEAVFSSFIKISNVFIVNLLFNSIQFGLLLSEGGLPYVEDIRGIGSTLLYFNIITVIAILYLKVRVMNPIIGQSE